MTVHVRLSRGQVVLVELDPVRGTEQRKTRPAVVVSNDGANSAASVRGRGIITVVPITSAIDRQFAFQARISAGDSGLSRDSKAQAEQVRSIDVTRVVRVLGWVSAEELGAVDDALRLHLSLG